MTARETSRVSACELRGLFISCFAVFCIQGTTVGMNPRITRSPQCLFLCLCLRRLGLERCWCDDFSRTAPEILTLSIAVPLCGMCLGASAAHFHPLPLSARLPPVACALRN
jgi:hypothetical protein